MFALSLHTRPVSKRPVTVNITFCNSTDPDQNCNKDMRIVTHVILCESVANCTQIYSRELERASECYGSLRPCRNEAVQFCSAAITIR